MKPINYKTTIKEHGLVLLFFVILTLIMTYPVIAYLTTHAAGDGGDGFAFKWNIWHVQRVLTGGEGIIDLYYTDYLYFPYGTSLAFETLSLTNTLFIAFPLSLITDNLVLIYNLLFLFNFVMAGYAMYLLTKYLVKDRAVAFLVGFAYTFSPLHMTWGLGYLSLISFCWTPLFSLFFFRMFEEEKIKNAIVAAIFLFFLALADWYHLLFAFLIAAPYFIYKLITKFQLFTKNLVIRMATLLFLFGIIICPFISPLIIEYLGTEKYYVTGLHTAVTSLDYIAPNRFHPLWKESQPILFEGTERGVALGYLVIFVSFLYLVKEKKKLFWFLLALFFFFLSLAPHLGAVSYFFKLIPVFKPLYHMGRFSFGVLFSFLIIFAYGLKYFLPKWGQIISKNLLFSRKKIKVLLTGSIFIILAMEYLAVPYPITYDYRRVEVELAREIGRAIKESSLTPAENFTILIIPPSSVIVDKFFLAPIVYWQTFHEKKMTEGLIPRPSLNSERALAKIRDIITTNNKIAFQEFIKDYNIGHIIFYVKQDIDMDIFLPFIEQVPQKLVFMTADEVSPIKIFVFEIVSKDYIE